MIVAITSSFAILLAARCLTAFATGAFWAVAAVVAARIVGPAASTARSGSSWAAACSPPSSVSRSVLPAVS